MATNASGVELKYVPRSNAEALRRCWNCWYDETDQEIPVTGRRQVKRAAGRNSVTMSRNRNLRARSFGAPRAQSNYSVADRGWPT